MPRYLVAPTAILVTPLFVTAPGLRAQVAGPSSPAPEASAAPIVLAQAQLQRRATAGKPSYAEMKDRYNKWTVGLAAGLYEGAGTRMAAELSKALEDDENMRVLPLLAKGHFTNVSDLLYLKATDHANVTGDTRAPPTH